VQLNLKNYLLLAKGLNKLTALKIAAKKEKKEILETLRRFSRNVQAILKNWLLPAID